MFIWGYCFRCDHYHLLVFYCCKIRTIFLSRLSLLKWKSWWIMAHLPCYALSSSLQMIHYLKLTEWETKTTQEASLPYLWRYEMKLSCFACCTNWPPMTESLDSHTAVMVFFQLGHRRLLWNIMGNDIPKIQIVAVANISFWITFGMAHVCRTTSHTTVESTTEFWPCFGSVERGFPLK